MIKPLPPNEPKHWDISPGVLLRIETGLRHSLDTNNKQLVSFDQVRECFNAIVMDAYNRNVTDDVMLECIQKATGVHTCLMALNAAHVYSSGLKKLGTETPNIDAAVKKLTSDLEGYRKWACEHLDRIMECRLEHESLS